MYHIVILSYFYKQNNMYKKYAFKIVEVSLYYAILFQYYHD